jgi:hypothetical protein
MRKLSTVLRQQAFHALLLFGALVVFSKPAMLTFPGESPLEVLLEFFLPWAVIIVVLFMVGLGLNREGNDEGAGADAGAEAGAGHGDRD